MGCSDPITGTIAQGRVDAAVDVIFERTLTNGCTLAAGGVVFERTLTNGRVGDASVGKERSITNGRVVVAGIIAKERLITVGRIVAPSGVAIERFLTDGGIVEAAKMVIGEAEPPSGGGMTACVFWTSAKQTSANVIRMIVFISGEFR
ncbi:MAG: hypothetical protein DME75_08170 [Verrucomicrobia bacterium]|nr:MAG: hypothetical protein DME75_08170 [Verrucomicrobiota bacterium]